MRCQLNPNSYNDAWYNKNQKKFYNQGADQLSTQANAWKWNSKGWPNQIKNIAIHGVTYNFNK